MGVLSVLTGAAAAVDLVDRPIARRVARVLKQLHSGGDPKRPRRRRRTRPKRR